MNDAVERMRSNIESHLMSRGIQGKTLEQATQLSLVTALSRIQNEIDRKKDELGQSRYKQLMTEYSIV